MCTYFVIVAHYELFFNLIESTQDKEKNFGKDRAGIYTVLPEFPSKYTEMWKKTPSLRLYILATLLVFMASAMPDERRLGLWQANRPVFQKILYLQTTTTTTTTTTAAPTATGVLSNAALLSGAVPTVVPSNNGLVSVLLQAFGR